MKKHLFYKGESVTPEDLNTAFARQFLFSDGVLKGFAVAKSGDFSLSISPGCALKSGYNLQSSNPLSVDISALLPSEGVKAVRVGIARSILYSGHVQNTDGLSVPQSSENTVSTLAAEELPAEYLPLARLTLNPQGLAEIEPLYTGFSLPLIEDICNPIGTIKTMLRLTAPSPKWLLLDGKTYKKTDYSILSSLLLEINPAWEADEETFTLPNLIGNNRFLRMAGGELALGSLQDCSVQNHVHDTIMGSHGHNLPNVGGEKYYAGGVCYGAGDLPAYLNTRPTDIGTKRSGNPVAGGAEETRPYAFAAHYFIKAR